MRSFAAELDELKRAGVFRSLAPSSVCAEYAVRDGARVFNFATNDYLGISSDLEFQREFLQDALENRGGEFLMSAVSSRLLGGDSPAFEELEKYFGELYSGECACQKSCLLFGGGYHANTGIIPALADSRDAIFCDRLIHASLVDALRLSPAKFFRFAHNDYGHLERLLSENRAKFDRAFIVSESVFSMDGDVADIAELVRLKRSFDAVLYMDEAHSFGLFGRGGLGLCAQSNLAADVDIIMCTLGKAVASQGAVAFVSPELRSLLVNRVRPFIFTTAMPPLSALWTRFVFEKIRKMDDRRAHLRELSASVRRLFPQGKTLGQTQIVPVLIGDEFRASEISESLLRAGWWAPAVRHPSVAKGAARLRLSLNAKMQNSELEKFAAEFNNTLKNEI